MIAGELVHLGAGWRLQRSDRRPHRRERFRRSRRSGSRSWPWSGSTAGCLAAAPLLILAGISVFVSGGLADLATLSHSVLPSLMRRFPAPRLRRARTRARARGRSRLLRLRAPDVRNCKAKAMPTIFSRIIEGELPGRFVWRDDICVGFLSINPLRPGHTLVVPRAEVDHWIDLPADTNAHLMRVAHEIGGAQMAAFAPTRIGLIIAGLEVPHVHLHVVPIDAERDLNFANADPSPAPSALDGRGPDPERLAESPRSRVQWLSAPDRSRFSGSPARSATSRGFDASLRDTPANVVEPEGRLDRIEDRRLHPGLAGERLRHPGGHQRSVKIVVTPSRLTRSASSATRRGSGSCSGRDPGDRLLPQSVSSGKVGRTPRGPSRSPSDRTGQAAPVLRVERLQSSSRRAQVLATTVRTSAAARVLDRVSEHARHAPHRHRIEPHVRVVTGAASRSRTERRARALLAPPARPPAGTRRPSRRPGRRRGSASISSVVSSRSCGSTPGGVRSRDRQRPGPRAHGAVAATGKKAATTAAATRPWSSTPRTRRHHARGHDEHHQPHLVTPRRSAVGPTLENRSQRSG